MLRGKKVEWEEVKEGTRSERDWKYIITDHCISDNGSKSSISFITMSGLNTNNLLHSLWWISSFFIPSNRKNYGFHPFPSSTFFFLTIRFSVGSLKSIDGSLLVLPLGLSPNILRWSTFSLLIGHFTFPTYLNFSEISRSSFSSSSITNSNSSIRHIHWSSKRKNVS